MQVIPDCSGLVLKAFIDENIDSDSTIVTDGWIGYDAIDSEKYTHKQQVAKYIEDKDSVLPGVHRIAALVKRLMLGTFQGRFGPSHLQSYLDEYIFRFNRRKSRYIGRKFMRIVQQVVASPRISYREIVGGRSPFHLLAN